jgi:hypothetical protein
VLLDDNRVGGLGVEYCEVLDRVEVPVEKLHLVETKSRPAMD